MDGRDATDGLLPPVSLRVRFHARAHLCMSSERELHTETVRAGGRRRAPGEWLGAARGLLCVHAEGVVRDRLRDELLWHASVDTPVCSLLTLHHFCSLPVLYVTRFVYVVCVCSCVLMCHTRPATTIRQALAVIVYCCAVWLSLRARTTARVRQCVCGLISL
jgi:hypothetical protein